jgi:hypothetical protein
MLSVRRIGLQQRNWIIQTTINVTGPPHLRTLIIKAAIDFGATKTDLTEDSCAVATGAGLLLTSLRGPLTKSGRTWMCQQSKTDRTVNMGEVVAVNFCVGRTLAGFHPKEIGEPPHKHEQQRRVRQLFTFAERGEPAIISRPESYGPDDCF